MADERPQLPDYYRVLGVGFDASSDELRRAWRAAVKQWHPDTNRSPDAHRMMARINEAWEVLGNAERRAEYDSAYFRHRAAMADEERRRQEAERRERERRERLRQQEMERKRRAEEEARRRAVEEEERRERERRAAEARRKAERERNRRDQQRIEKERREREERNRKKREKEERKRRARAESAGQPGGFRKVQFWGGFAGGVLLSLIAAAIVVLFLQLDNWRNQGDTSLIETAGWGTVMATGDGSIDCSAQPGGVRNVAAFGEYPSAEALFLTPGVENWSAGFLYHSSRDGYSVAAVRRTGEQFKVVNWTRLGSADVTSQERRFRPDLLHPDYSSVPNSIKMDVSNDGSVLSVNGVTLAHVPSRDLRPHASPVHFCAGIFGEESTYTMQFVGLQGSDSSGLVTRTAGDQRQHWPSLAAAKVPRVVRVTATPSNPTPRVIRVTATPTPAPRIVYVTATPRPTPWPTPVPLPTATPRPTVRATSAPSPMPELTLRGPGNGSLDQDATDGFIGCPDWTIEPAYISSYATYGGVEFSFEVPSASSWSIGLLYHNTDDTDAATFVYQSRNNVGVRVDHWTRVQGNVVDFVYPVAVVTGAFDGSVGSRNEIAIRTDQDGTEVTLNGSFALKVPADELRPAAGSMEVCAGFLTDEFEDYQIDYFGLRAWTE